MVMFGVDKEYDEHYAVVLLQVERNNYVISKLER